MFYVGFLQRRGWGEVGLFGGIVPIRNGGGGSEEGGLGFRVVSCFVWEFMHRLGREGLLIDWSDVLLRLFFLFFLLTRMIERSQLVVVSNFGGEVCGLGRIVRRVHNLSRDDFLVKQLVTESWMIIGDGV